MNLSIYVFFDMNFCKIKILIINLLTIMYQVYKRFTIYCVELFDVEFNDSDLFTEKRD
ncbi:hypothetical protein FHX64_002171 [Microbacter margulisiae]|uniref:Uncharacterized protein n=1 Tax=Microbacter margulisiae TaxID=1350067 RepID=A0A7W5DSK8_9PORP|nr:hypothetical protein [Microbacter margulisiae]